MKRLMTLLFILYIVWLPMVGYAQPADSSSVDTILIEEIRERLPSPVVSAEGAVVIEQKTGKVLFGKNHDVPMYPASTTKVLTALIAIEEGDLQEVVKVGEEVWMVPRDSSLAGLYIEEEITLENLIYGLMINSGNEAANAIAVHIARSVSDQELSTQEALEYFAGMMNRRAVEAGAKSSNFVNPHGYHDPAHITTAYDLAMITRAAMSYPVYRDVVSRIFMETVYWKTGEPRYWRSRNRLIDPANSHYYAYATGGKTGWTSHSGPCLISSAAKDGQEMVAVVLKAQSNQQWNDSTQLLEYGLTNFAYVELLTKGTIMETLPVDNYALEDWGSLAVEIAAEDFGDVFPRDKIAAIQPTITWDQTLMAPSRGDHDRQFRLLAPIQKGQLIGELTMMLDDTVVAASPLTAVRNVEKRTVLERILPGAAAANEGFALQYIFLIIISLLVMLRLLGFVLNRRRKRRSFYPYKR